MVIHEYGDSSLPKIVLLHPMLADARCMLRLTESMEGVYCAIIPDLSGQGGGFRRIWECQTGGGYAFRLFERKRIHTAGAADGSVSRRTGGNVPAGAGGYFLSDSGF